MALCFIRIKGLIKILYAAATVLIVWFFIHHLCPKSKKKIEFFIGNISFTFPFSNNLSKNRSNYPYLEIGEIIPNCGIESPCPENHFALHLHTGKSISDKPKICIGGKYVVHENIKNGVRGFNVVIVDPRRREAVAAKGLDSHKHSKDFEEFLSKGVRDEEIVVGMTFDEAASKLTGGVRKQFADLGSGMIQNLQTRDQWFMVSQKGIEGFSPYEALLPFRSGSYESLDRRLCVPTKIKGQSIIPDPPVQNNLERETFCHKHSSMGDFCSPDHLLNDLRPGLMVTPNLKAHKLRRSPVLVFASKSLSALSSTLETVLSQPGIDPKAVTVIYDPRRMTDVPGLCSLFRFLPLRTEVETFWETLEAGMGEVTRRHPGAAYVTLVREGVLLSPDFASYVVQAAPLLEDPAVIGISAWNPNGFTEVSGRSDLAYRVESIALLAFTTKKATYYRHLKHHLKQCCGQREWNGGWSVPSLEGKHVIIPDVSRCFYDPHLEGLRSPPAASSLFASLFYRERRTSVDPNAKIANVSELLSSNYDALLQSILSSNRSRRMEMSKEQVLSFYEESTLRFLANYLANDNETASPSFPLLVVPFVEALPKTSEGMKMLCRCFGLAYHRRATPVGIYKGTLRFTVNKVQIMLLSSASPFFKSSPYANSTLLTLP